MRGGSRRRSSACARASRTADGTEGSPGCVGHPAPSLRGRARRGRFRAARRLLRRGRARRHSGAGHRRRGNPPRGARAPLVADLFLQAADNRLQVAVHCGAQTTAETVRSRRARRRGRRGRGRGHRPAVLPSRRASSVHALPGCRPGVRAASLLRLRVRVDERLRRRSGCARASSRRGAEPRRASRCRTPRSSASRVTCSPISTSSSGRRR